jgi:hypothetical protein
MELIEEKIQIIAKEIQEANASQWTITKIIKVLSEMKTTNEKKLREKTLKMLLDLDANAATIYQRFSSMKVYTSKEVSENFNRGNIIKSLLNETGLSRSVAEKITTEVEDQIKDSKISFLTTGVIRELVNSKLISYGFEDIRNHYARLGEPAYEIKKKLEKEPHTGEQVREYNNLLVIPKGARELHHNGTIYIEDVEGFSHRPYSYTYITEKKETLEKTLCNLTRNLVETRKNFFLPPNVTGITFACAPFAKNKSQTKKVTHLIEEMLKIPGPGFTTSLDLFTPSYLENFSEYRLKAAEISNFLLGQTNSSLGIDSKYSLKLIKPEGKNFLILNNSNEEYFALNNKLFSTTQGIDLFVNINLEKIASEDEKELTTNIEEIGKEIEKIVETKKNLLLRKKYNEPFCVEKMKTGIGLTSLFKAGENVQETKGLEIAKKIYKEISKIFPDYLLFGLSSEKVRERFSALSRKEIFSQETLGFVECLGSKKCCFTGKATTIKEVGELIDNKVKQIEFVGEKNIL